jgi:hypothetical protein
VAEAAATATPIDREASGWFESAAPGGGPTVQRRVDRRTRRMEAYPPIDRKARAAQGAGGAPLQGPSSGEAHANGQDTQGGPPTDRDPGP